MTYSKSISRRTLLRGTGAALALPWLEAMAPKSVFANTSDEKAPVRMAVLYVPNGIHPDIWNPKEEGTDFELPMAMEPLADIRHKNLVLTNLWNQHSNTGDGHYVKTGGFLTGQTINKTVGVDLNSNGVSMDQLAARQVEHLTPLPSLELGTEPVHSGVDGTVGYTRVYGAHISWKTPTSPLAKEIDPKLVYQRMFRASKQGTQAAADDRLLLDKVLTGAKSLRGRLGQEDRHRMDEYLESVRTVEARLAQLEQPGHAPWRPKADIEKHDSPEGIPDAHAQHVQLMMDMIVLAFQTDTTRVTSFMFGNAVSNKDFAFLDGVKGAHHSLSHHQSEEDKLKQYNLISQWHVAQYAYLLKRLDAIQEGDATLLDNSMILFGSGLKDGHSHSPRDLPILLGGRGGGKINTGRHIRYEKNTPLANLYVSMLNAFGRETEVFSDSRGKLEGVLV